MVSGLKLFGTDKNYSAHPCATSKIVLAHPYWNKKMADRTGFEPATSGVTGRHSNQLNYRSVECYLMVGAEGVEPPTFAL